MADEDLKVTSGMEAGDRVLSVEGEIDIVSVTALIQALRKANDAGGSVVVDLAGVTYIDSQGIRALRNAYQQAASNGGALRLRGCKGVVERVLRTVGLDRVVPME